MCAVLTLIVLASVGCGPTRDANFLPIELGRKPYPPWKAPSYTAKELVAMFPGEDYSRLRSVHVARDGDDKTADGGRSRPHATIGAALSAHGAKGVIIRVHRGVYAEHLRIDVRATFAQPFVLYSEDGPGAAVIDGGGEAQRIIGITGRYTVLDGFEVRNTRDYAVSLSPTGRGESPVDAYIVVRNNHVHHTGRDAIKLGNANFFLIEGNEIHNISHERQPDNAIDGVAVYHSLCRNNHIHDTGVGAGGYFKGGSANNLWVGNTFENIGETGNSWERGSYGLQLGGAGQFSWRDQRWYEYPAGSDQLAYNNLFINCRMGGVALRSVHGAKVFHNTFVNCGHHVGDESRRSGVIRALEPTHIDTADVTIANNIIYNDAAHPIEDFVIRVGDSHPRRVRSHHNIVYSKGRTVRLGTVAESAPSDLQVDPQLSDATGGDLRPLADSPAIDSGESLAEVPVDYDGTPRPQGDGVDRGAYER